MSEDVVANGVFDLRRWLEKADAIRQLKEELDAITTVGADSAVSGVEGLPTGSGLLVVKRGPNAGSRFLLDRPVMAAGRQPRAGHFFVPRHREPPARGVPVGEQRIPRRRRR